MKLIVCVDLRGGMLFNHRRVSRDCVVSRMIIDDALGCTLWVRPKSLELFSGLNAAVSVVEDDILRLPEQGCIFLEESVDVSLLQVFPEVIVYRWDRIYPSDVTFPEQALKQSWKRVEYCEFTGNSHETVSREVYRNEKTEG